MSSGLQKCGMGLAVAVAAMMSITPALAGDKAATFTGKVSDAMCGAQHMMPGDAAACIKACVNKGSKYALVVGDKVYTLDTTDKAALAELDKMAGESVKVTGTAKEDTIEVKSVAAAK